MRGGRALLAGLALVGLVAGCTGDDAPSATPRRRESRPAVVDYSGAQLSKVPGTTTTAVPAETGTASIVGTVSSAAGRVPGATVRVEHLVRGTTVVHDVLTGADGTYSLTGIPGGRYRVRAFLPPALAVAKGETRFLEDGKPATFDLVLEDQRKVVASSAISPRVPYLGDPVNLAVVVATLAVDADGVVRSTPVPGLRVDLDGVGDTFELRRDDDGLQSPLQPRQTTTTGPAPSATAYTDGIGSAQFALRCVRPGAAGLGLLVTVTVTPPAVEGQPPPLPEQRTERLELKVPACVDPTTATAPSTTSTEG